MRWRNLELLSPLKRFSIIIPTSKDYIEECLVVKLFFIFSCLVASFAVSVQKIEITATAQKSWGHKTNAIYMVKILVRSRSNAYLRIHFTLLFFKILTSKGPWINSKMTFYLLKLRISKSWRQNENFFYI